MITQAKQTGKKLLIEDCGIAMPISLLVFLFLSFLCMSVFAVGEVIRTRTELQYKVDNAAYAAALVQADSLSRIAILNRALAWTYAQTNKRQMDYVVNRWLSESLETFIEDAETNEKQHLQASSAACTQHNINTLRGNDWGGGGLHERHTTEYGYQYHDVCYGVSNMTDDLKGKLMESLAASSLSGGVSAVEKIHGHFIDEADMRNAKALQEALGVEGFAPNQYASIASDIQIGFNNIDTINEQIATIKNNMSAQIDSAVGKILGEDSNYHYSLALGKAWYSEENPVAANYLETISSWDEFKKRYMKFAEDTDEWYKNWWTSVDSKIQHQYSGNFELKWQGYYVGWICKQDNNSHENTTPVYGLKRIAKPGAHPNGNTAWGNLTGDMPWNLSPVAKPLKLNRSFFGKDGAIVIAVKTPIPSLFRKMNLNGGFFDSFAITGDMWAISASRAGYRIPGITSSYENSKFEQDEQWNLFIDDWDAMLLPVTRCWKSWNSETFDGDDAYTVLSAAKASLAPESAIEFDTKDKVNMDMLH